MNVKQEKLDQQDSLSWEKLWSVFQATLDVEPLQRNEYLKDSCGADQDLYSEVLELLVAHETESILDTSPYLGSVPTSNVDEEFLHPFGLESGDILAKRFELIRPLGRGGMARVYEAKDLDLGTRVAVKILRGDLAADPRALERFNREVNLAIRITHPNVCRIYDLFHHGELSFLTMQLLEGETLHHRIQNTGPLNEGKAFPIIEQLAEALSAAHNLGIIHRDLKPTNVMLVSKDSSDHVVLTDFGTAVAFAETRLTGDGQFLGTPEYMAPEQLRGENVSPATDVYALGLLMYEMVTGKQPFPGDSPYTIISSRLRSQIVSPRKINRGLSRTWEKTILRCLELDPKDRIQTPTDVIVALKGGAVSLRLFTNRRKKQIAAASAIVLLALIGVLFLVYQPMPKQPVATLPFEKRDWLLVCAFENTTGDRSLDGVEFILKRELENSQFINVVPTERVVDSLALMRKPADTRIDIGIAHQILLRDAGIRALLTGNIVGSGTHYVVNAEIAAGNVTVSKLSAKANSKDDLLKAMRQLSGEVRQILGEQESEIQKTEKKLEAVTTPSLRALQLFSQADHLMAIGPSVEGLLQRQAEAEKLLRQAIATDSGFASAYAHLACAIQNQGKSGYLPFAKRAFELSENVSDRERYFIRAVYLDMNGNYEEAASDYQLLVHFFPDYVWSYNGLIDVLAKLHRFDEAIPYIIRYSEIRPNDFDVVTWAADTLTHANRFKEAETLYGRASQLALQMPNPQLSQLTVDAGVDFIRMQRFWIHGDPKSEFDLLKQWKNRLESGISATDYIRFQICYGYMSIGRFGECKEIFQLETDNAMKDWRLRQIELYQLPPSKWGSVLRKYHLSDPPDMNEAVFWSSAGLTSEARKILQAVPESKYNSSLTQTIQGQIALAERKPVVAIPLLESALEGLRQQKDGTFFHATLSLAKAWLKLGKSENAIRALENASPYKNEMKGVISRILWTQIQLQLADLYSQSGRHADAEKVLSELRKILAYADSEYWIIKELNRRNRSNSNLFN